MEIEARRGFTLIEVVVVLAITATVLAAAAPRVAEAIGHHVVDQAARRVAAELSLARVRAIVRGAPVRLRLRLASGTWKREVSSGGVWEPETPARSLPAGVRFDPGASSRVTRGEIAIRFEARGYTSTNAGIALREAGGARRRVIVNTMGRVRVER